VTIFSDFGYQNVQAFTKITEAIKQNIQVYWLTDGGKKLVENVDYIDTNNNGLVDELRWVVPHLSNQTYEISITVLNPYTY